MRVYVYVYIYIYINYIERERVLGVKGFSGLGFVRLYIRRDLF